MKKILTSFLLSILFMLGINAQAVHQLSSKDFVKEFAVAGPFTQENMTPDRYYDLLDLAFVESENQLGTKPGNTRLIKCEAGPEGILDLNKALGNSDYAVAYACFKIASDKDTKALLDYRADDGAMIYVNGDYVYAASSGGWGNAGDRCLVALKEGVNDVVFKVANRDYNWDLKVKVLDEVTAKEYLDKADRESEGLQFLHLTLQPKTDRNSSPVLKPGKFPELVFDKPGLAKQFLGGDYGMEVKWFDRDLNEVHYPKSAGRYAYYATIRGTNGTELKKGGTLFCSPTEWLGWNERLYAGPDFFPVNGISEQVWTTHKQAIGEYAGFNMLKSILTQQDAIILAFVDEMNRSQLPAGKLNTPIIVDGDYHAKLKQKILGVEGKYPALKPPAKTSAPILQKLSVTEAKKYATLNAELRQIGSAWMEDDGSPFDMVLAKDGNIIFHGSFGEDEYGKFTTETPSEIASITKLLTGVLFAQFVDQGIIGIDDPVGKYLPEFPLTGPNALTLRHCFTHTNAFYGHALYGGVHNPWLENNLHQVIKEDTVGTWHEYNGMGYDLAGKVMEVVTGKSIFRLFREYLYDPLGMNNTVHDWDLGYSCHSTAYDLAKVAQMILNKGKYGDNQFFSEATFDKILPVELSQYYPGIEQKWGIGITMMNWKVKDETTGEEHFLLSDNIIGHGSATASVFWVDLENNIVLTQSRRRGNTNFAKHFQRMVESIEKHLVEPAK